MRHTIFNSKVDGRKQATRLWVNSQRIMKDLGHLLMELRLLSRMIMGWWWISRERKRAQIYYLITSQANHSICFQIIQKRQPSTKWQDASRTSEVGPSKMDYSKVRQPIPRTQRKSSQAAPAQDHSLTLVGSIQILWATHFRVWLNPICIKSHLLNPNKFCKVEIQMTIASTWSKMLTSKKIMSSRKPSRQV